MVLTRTSKQQSRVAKGSKKQSIFKNRWVIVGIVGLVAIIGIVIIRTSFAFDLPTQGRMPEEGNPYVSYSVNILNGSVTLKKSTNGETRTAGSIDEAYAVGEQMYNEMVAAATPAPAPAPANPAAPARPATPANTGATPAATPTTDPSTPNTSQSPTGTATNSDATTDGQQSTSNSASPSKQFVFTIRRNVVLVPKLPSDTTQVASVQYSLDGKAIGTATASPFTAILRPSKFSSGTHTLTTKVQNKDGSTQNSYSYTIKIDNASSPLDRLLEFLGL